MPSLTVTLEGDHLATIDCTNYHVVAVRMSGTRVEQEFATLEMTASTHPEGQESTYQLWINNHVLTPGQVVTVSFTESGATSHTGKTIDELYPDENSPTEQDPKSIEECFRELRARPNLRVGYSFALSTPKHTSYTGRTNESDYGLSFHVLWNWVRPNRASVSLESYTIDSIEQRLPGREHANEYISPGHTATIRVDA